MIKIKELLYLILTILLLISCKNANSTPIEKIIKLSKNEEIKTLLEYPVKTSESPSGKYIFVYAKGVEPYDDEDVLMKDALKGNFEIDNFIFNKGEYKWWFIFNIKKKEIIIKGSDLVLFDDSPLWDEKNNILILRTSTSPKRDLLFFNLEEYKYKPFMLYIYFKNEYSYEISNNKNYIAYQHEAKVDDFSGMPLKIGIKIRDLNKNKDISIINPTVEKGILEIIKWESNNKLIYKEIDRDKKSEKILTFELK